MGSIEPFEEEASFESRIKYLQDDELLDVWAESQQIEAMLDLNIPGHSFPGENFEALIVHELRLRACRRFCSK